MPIRRVVTYAVQPGTMYVNATNQVEAIKIARERIEADWSGAAGMEWEPNPEIQDAECPEIDDDLGESDVLPVDDVLPALRPHSPEKKPGIDVTVSENAVSALVAELEATLAVFSPSDEREEKHKEGLAEWVNALFFANRIVLEPSETEPDASAAEPLETEAGQ